MILAWVESLSYIFYTSQLPLPHLTVSEEGEVSVHILHTLYFDAERKRMSVIIQHPATNDIVLYCKGADTAIIPHLKPTAAGN